MPIRFAAKSQYSTYIDLYSSKSSLCATLWPVLFCVPLWNMPWRWCVFLPDVTSLCSWLSHGDNVPFPVSCEFSTTVVCGSFKRGLNFWSNRFDMAWNCWVVPHVQPLQVSFSWWDVWDHKCVRKRFFVFCHDRGNIREELRFGADAKKAPQMLVLRAFDSDVWFWHVLRSCLLIEKSKSRSLPSVCFDTFVWCDFDSYVHVGPCHSNKILPVCLM